MAISATAGMCVDAAGMCTRDARQQGGDVVDAVLAVQQRRCVRARHVGGDAGVQRRG